VRPSDQRPRVAITGASGFIGGYLVSRYLAAGFPVRAISRPARDSGSRGDITQQPLQTTCVDLLDPRSLRGAFEDCALVIHAAVSYSGSASTAVGDHPNVVMAASVVEESRKSGVRRLVHLSTTAAIGISTDPRKPADESQPFNLDGLGLIYATSKLEAEKLVLAANGPELETVVANPGFTFGVSGSRYRGGEVIERVLRTRFVVCTKGGLSIVHVNDLVEGISRVAEVGRPGERYILSGENISFERIAEVVVMVYGLRRTIVVLPDLVRNTHGTLARLVSRGVEPNLSFTRDFAYRYFSSAKAAEQLQYAARPFSDIVEEYVRFTSPLAGS
jgi:dihydroflavonol-4-reductase